MLDQESSARKAPQWTWCTAVRFAAPSGRSNASTISVSSSTGGVRSFSGILKTKLSRERLTQDRTSAVPVAGTAPSRRTSCPTTMDPKARRSRVRAQACRIVPLPRRVRSCSRALRW
ncbi:uncharacterized protein B0H18DRAFT_1043817 [Fomitopsis serialis]|uniref:uncharacterized protein n=1 Tax=Fomitopsis serialis TaxID=139415 RepID=UPI002008A6E7|nr:uncharacterized protein B0H18DRAFT_1043817 [Neoantrodia serialis]KAH9914948.1 hypothetical protein B0H18DRAFT_1043817 [Neoantrodia serialis]